MNPLESAVRRVKSSVGLTSQSRLVVAVRPVYDMLLNTFYGNRGLERVINGSEVVRVRPSQRYAEEGYEPAVFDCIKSRLKPGAVVLDIGAHIGLSSILMSRWVGPTGRVYAFEPTKQTRTILEDHLRLNDMEKTVTVVPKAVSDQCGKATFYTYADSPEATLSTQHGRLPGATAQEVEVTTVDAFCGETNVKPEFIKLDIEGFEFHALRGARETLRACNPAIVVEFHPMNWPEIGITPEAARAELADLGYRAVALEGQQDPYAQHGHVILDRVAG